MPLKITITDKDSGIFIVAPEGQINNSTYRIMEDHIKPLLDSKLNSQMEIMAFDLRSVNYIASLGFGLLLKLKRILNEKNISIMFFNIQPQVKAIFKSIEFIPNHIFKDFNELYEFIKKQRNNIQNENKNIKKE